MTSSLSLEMLEAHNKIRRVINSCLTTEHLQISVNMIHAYEDLYKRKKGQKHDKEFVSELYFSGDRLRRLVLEKEKSILK